MPSPDQNLQEGIRAVKSGSFERARRLFNLVVEEDPDSEEGWYWLGLIAPDQDKRVACFLRTLEINPSNQQARDRLLRLGIPIPEDADQTGSASTALSTDEEETGPLPGLPGQGGDSQIGQSDSNPEVFEPLNDEEEQQPPAESARKTDDGGAGNPINTLAYDEEDYTIPPDDEELIGPGLVQRPSTIGKLLPILVILIVVACGSLIYLATRGDGVLFGLALAQSSPTPSPTATRPPPTATNTRTPQPTSTQTPVPPTLMPTATLSPLDSLIRLNQLLSESSGLAQAGQYEDAIQAWDRVIEIAPENAEVIFGRGRSYLQQATESQPIPENAQELLQDALGDLNQAILIGPVRGVYYLTRYEITSGLAQYESLRVKRLSLLEQMLADVQTAGSYGLTTPLGDPNPGNLLNRLGRCQEAMAYLDQQVTAYPNAIPPADLYTELARTYLCYGQLRGASLYANMAYTVEPTPEREWLQAITLYNQGRYNETLAVLNDLLEAHPDSPGDRYFLRALVRYQRREYELAQADLDLGTQKSHNQDQLAAYAAGLLASQDGDPTGAEALFNRAEETLSLEYGLILNQIQKELGLPTADRGIPTLPKSIIRYLNNPPETLQPVIPLTEPEEILLPEPYEGSGAFHLIPGEPLNLHLFPPVPLDILFVDSLTLRLSSSTLPDLTNVQSSLWDFGQGEWVTISLEIGENKVSEPSRFVNPLGDIYLRVENKSNQILAFNNLNITLAIAGQTDTSQP